MKQGYRKQQVRILYSRVISDNKLKLDGAIYQKDRILIPTKLQIQKIKREMEEELLEEHDNKQATRIFYKTKRSYGEEE